MQRQGGVGGLMGRNGGALGMWRLTISTVNAICTEDVPVQESLWNLFIISKVLSVIPVSLTTTTTTTTGRTTMLLRRAAWMAQAFNLLDLPLLPLRSCLQKLPPLVIPWVLVLTLLRIRGIREYSSVSSPITCGVHLLCFVFVCFGFP